MLCSIGEAQTIPEVELAPMGKTQPGRRISAAAGFSAPPGSRLCREGEKRGREEEAPLRTASHLPPSSNCPPSHPVPQAGKERSKGAPSLVL